MILLKNNIKNQILSGFFVFITLLSLIITVSFYFLARVNEIRFLSEQIQEVDIARLELYNKQLYFMENEVLDSNLYITKSQYPSLLTQKKAFIKLTDEIDSIIDNKEVENLSIKHELTKIKANLESSNVIFFKIVEKQIEKGFKNWGVIGEMRQFAHIIEDEELIKESLLLSLRRNEKDYLLRKELKYQDELVSLSNNIIKQLQPNKKTEKVIQNYLNRFNKVVALDEELGDFYKKKGLKYELLDNINSNNIAFAQIINTAKKSQDGIIATLKMIYIVFSFVTVLTGLFLGYFLANKFSKPIRKLVLEINKILNTENNFHLQLNNKNASEEVKEMHLAFNKLMNKINKQFTEIRKSNHQLEEQNDVLLKVNKELDHFVYSASHDLRAPIVTIKGLLELVKIENVETVKEDYLKKIGICLNKLDNFIADILNISRNARIIPNYTVLNLWKIIEEIFDQYEFEYPKERFDKLIEIENESITVISDAHRIKVILDNLVANGLRYHRKSARKPFVKIYIKIEEEVLLIKVADNGIGILEKELPKIYDMFYRATDYKHGSGLGLYIVKEVIEKLEGNINVTSELGSGTEFSIVLPNNLSAQKKKNLELLTAK